MNDANRRNATRFADPVSKEKVAHPAIVCVLTMVLIPVACSKNAAADDDDTSSESASGDAAGDTGASGEAEAGTSEGSGDESTQETAATEDGEDEVESSESDEGSAVCDAPDFEGDYVGAPAGLSGVRVVNGSVQITEIGEDGLLELSCLETVNGAIYLLELLGLTTMEGLANLTFVGGSLIIGSNPDLIDLAGLEALQEVPENLRIIDCPNLATLAGLQSLGSVGDELRISNTGASELTGLENLFEIGGTLQIRRNEYLQTLAGFGPVSTIESLVVTENPALQSLAGFEVVDTLSFGYEISENSSLVDVTALSGALVGSDTGVIWIESNPQLSTCQAYELVEATTSDTFMGEVVVSMNLPDCP